VSEAIITSLRNPRVKEAVALRDSRYRRKAGRMLVDGARELARAVRSGVTLCEAFVCDALCRGPEADDVLGLLPKSGAAVYRVTPQVFEKLAFGARTDGVLGVALPPSAELSRCRLPNRPLVAVLEGVEKPGNFGAVLRSADGAGVSALVAAAPRTDLFNPNVVRASLGTIFTVPVAEASAADALDWLRQHGLAMYAARIDASIPYTEADFARPCAILLGIEAEGLSDIWRGDDITGVRVPMLGMADSLNVSAAAAVLFYEALRQRSMSVERGHH
jgi:RNA methyltransferase, TrmH family